MAGMKNLRNGVNRKEFIVIQLALTKWEKALVKEIIADMMDSHGGNEKPQVKS
jgi:hypothetical protein